MGDMRVDLDSWFALHDDAVYTGMSLGREFPVGCCCRGEPGDMLECDHRFAVTNTLGGESNRGHLSWLHCHHRAVDALGREPAFGALAHLVEVDAQIVCQAAHLAAPHRHRLGFRELVRIHDERLARQAAGQPAVQNP